MCLDNALLNLVTLKNTFFSEKRSIIEKEKNEKFQQFSGVEVDTGSEPDESLIRQTTHVRVLYTLRVIGRFSWAKSTKDLTTQNIAVSYSTFPYTTRAIYHVCETLFVTNWAKRLLSSFILKSTG